METVIKLNIPVFIRSSKDDHVSPYRIAKLAKNFSVGVFIMYSMGKSLLWYDCIELAEQYKNIVLDTTDVMFENELVETAYKFIGASRIIRGTNLPLSYPAPQYKENRNC